MTKKAQAQLNKIRTMMRMSESNRAIAKAIKVTEAGFPHRVTSLLRQEVNHDGDD